MLKTPIDRLKKNINDSIVIKKKILADEHLLRQIIEISALLVDIMRQGNRVIFAGNGGSAADAQHLAAEFVSRFEFDRPGLPALSLATDTSMLTAIGNDYGYEKIFLRQLQAQSRPGDVFFGITTSGTSPNILSALNACKKLEVTSVALCGLGGDLDGIANYVLRAPSMHTPRIQECHIAIGHAICAEVEIQVFGNLVHGGS